MAAALLGVFLISFVALGDESRVWVDSTGKHKIEATLVSHTDATVKLRRTDGRIIEMPIDKLSADDRAFLKGGDSSSDSGTVASQEKQEKKEKSKGTASKETAPKKTTSDSTPASSGNLRVSGKTYSAGSFGDKVYFGDPNDVLLLPKAPVEMEWNYRPKTIEAPEKSRDRNFSIGKNSALKEKKFSLLRFVADVNDPNAPIYVSLADPALKNETYVARCDRAKGSFVVGTVPFAEAALADVSPDGNYALFVVTRKRPASQKKFYLAITPLKDLADGQELGDTVLFDPFYTEDSEVDSDVESDNSDSETPPAPRFARPSAFDGPSAFDMPSSSAKPSPVVAEKPTTPNLDKPASEPGSFESRRDAARARQEALRAEMEARHKQHEKELNDMMGAMRDRLPGNLPGNLPINLPTMPEPNASSPRRGASSFDFDTPSFEPKSKSPDPGEVYEAFWIDSSKILVRTQGAVTLWDLTTCQAIYQMVTAGRVLVVDPSRKAFVLACSDLISVYSALDGSPLGSLPLSYFGKTRASEIKYTNAIVAFSPSGRFLAVSESGSVKVVDMEKGEISASFVIVDDSPGRCLVWGTDEYLIASGVGYDLKTRSPICCYLGLENAVTPTLNVGGRVWAMTSDTTLVGVELPQSAALEVVQTVRKKAEEKNYELQQGDALSIRCELNKFHDQKQVEDILKKALEKQGFKYDPNSKLTLIAKTVDTKRTEVITVVETEERVPVGQQELPPALRGYTQRRVKQEKDVEVKVYEQSLVIEKDGKPIWEDFSETVGTIDGERNWKSIERQVKELNVPEIGFYKSVRFPKFIEREEKPITSAKSTMKAKITSYGLM